MTERESRIPGPVEEKASGAEEASSSLSSQEAVFTDPQICRDIVNRNPMCTGKEVIPDYLNGIILVDWEGPQDKKNPRNWPVWRRLLVTLLIALCTTSLYMPASIVTPAQEEIQNMFHTTKVKAALDITLFVWGYGLGSLWFTPMSEIPVFRGRTPTYLACQLIFCVLQIPTALTSHLGAFCVLRFLAGIFSSPPLSTAAATISDLWDMPWRILAIIIWAFGAIAGPFIGPLIGAALTLTHPPSYIFWYVLAVSGGLLIFMVIFLQETSEQELLMRKAIRLRKATSDDRYISPGEILMHTQTVSAVLYEMFFKPIKMTITEPVLLFINFHISLVYFTVYLYLEAMPIVYIEMYKFNTVQMGLCFFAFLVGATCAALCYIFYTFSSAKRMGEPEKVFGPSATFGAIMLPVGMFLWGWLSSPHIHWAIGFMGNFFFAVGAFVIFQSYFAMLSVLYPPSSAGSAFASNNIARSLLGGSACLYGGVMYTHTSIDNYPVGWGCSIIGFVGIMLIPFPIFLTLKGRSLRQITQKKYSRE